MQPQTSPYPMIPISDAIRTIATSLQPLQPIKVPTTQALHTILAEPIHSPHPHPPFRASIKDGYAVTLPCPKTLQLAQPSHAGSPIPPPLQPNHAAYVTTGAPLPPNASAVVMVENCIVENTSVTILTDVNEGLDIRQVGSDLAQGQLVLPVGTRLGAAEIGLLASCAVTKVTVHPRPTVGVLSSGDELIDPADITTSLPPGMIVDSNRRMLLDAITESLPFCKPVDLGLVRDSEQAVEEALKSAMAQCNIVITSGGVSMGNKDFIKPVITRLANIHFGRVIMKPGKPLTFATSGPHTCFVGLPGNPVSCFVCFHLAVAVAARRLAGCQVDDAVGKVVHSVLGCDIKLDPERPEYHRAKLQWKSDVGWVAYSTGKQASSRLLSARSADALLALPARQGILKEGERVKAHLLPNLALTGWGASSAPEITYSMPASSTTFVAPFRAFQWARPCATVTMTDSETRRMKIFYTPLFNRHRPPPGMSHPECPQRLDSCVKALKGCSNLSPLLDWETPQSVSLPENSERREEVLSAVGKVHTEDYLIDLEQLSTRGGGLDTDTYVAPGSYDIALLAASAWLEAVDYAIKHGATFALARPPGHHAIPVTGQGFCLLSNAAIAARYALTKDEISRVAILDFDVHHGNGTQAAVKSVEEIRFVSSHEYPLYPGSGEAGVVGEFNNILNVTLPAGTGMDTYKEIYENEMLPFLLDDVKPDLVIVSAGFDALDVDPLAGLDFKTEDYRVFIELLVERAGEDTKFVFGLEGGYYLGAGGVGDGVKECVLGFCLPR